MQVNQEYFISQKDIYVQLFFMSHLKKLCNIYFISMLSLLSTTRQNFIIHNQAAEVLSHKIFFQKQATDGIKNT